MLNGTSTAAVAEVAAMEAAAETRSRLARVLVRQGGGRKRAMKFDFLATLHVVFVTPHDSSRFLVDISYIVCII